METMKSIVSIVCILVLFNSCKESNDEDETVLPSNLVISSEVSADGSGLVTFSAIAQNASFYFFQFGEDPDQNPEQTFGEIDHVYKESGLYTVTVTAHSDAENFISGTEEVDVQIFINIPETGYSTPDSYPDMQLLWSDEFNGTEMNSSLWTFDNGDGCPNLCGWGNNELEYYRPENTRLIDGVLAIEAKEENFEGADYTSSKLITQGKMSFRYGRIDIRAVLPEGQGIWPAFWLLPEDNVFGGWAASGEIDIMEMVGHDAETIHGTIHYGGEWPNNQFSGTGYTLESGIFKDEWHVFSLIWNENLLEWYVDDQLFYTRQPSDLGTTWPFNEDFYFIMNLAVGGNWPGPPNSETIFPQRLLVDYVRVFQETN